MLLLLCVAESFAPPQQTAPPRPPAPAYICAANIRDVRSRHDDPFHAAILHDGVDCSVFLTGWIVLSSLFILRCCAHLKPSFIVWVDY